MTYRVERQGDRWVATDGVNRVEGDEPDEALADLVRGQVAAGEGEPADADAVADAVAGVQADDEAELLCVRVARLIQLVAVRAPGAVLRAEVGLVGKSVERLIGLDGLED